MTTLSAPQLIELVQSLVGTVQSLQHQLEWFQRQMFGTKSERMRVLEGSAQLALEGLPASTDSAAPPKERTIPAHKRRVAKGDAVGDSESVPFFDEARVPMETIELRNPALEGLSPEQFEVIGQKVSFRLAQRPGSYVVLRYVRSLIKRLDTQEISCPPAPQGVIDGSRADVSFVVGLLVDKFRYHTPLYRQHQRLEDCGFNVSRPWLTQVAQKAIALLEPIYDAQFDSIRCRPQKYRSRESSRERVFMMQPTKDGCGPNGIGFSATMSRRRLRDGLRGGQRIGNPGTQRHVRATAIVVSDPAL
jgi:transposase